MKIKSNFELKQVFLILFINIQRLFLIETKQCTDLPLFLNFTIGRGIDIASIDLYPRLLDLQKGYTMFKEQLISLNCDKNELINIQGKDYQLPDEIFRIYDYLSQDYTRHGLNFKDELDYRKKMCLNFGIDLTDGVLRSSPTYRRIKRQDYPRIRDRVQYIQLQKNVLLREPYSLKLNEKLETEFKKLPEEYNDNPRAYQEFIEKFGTHYFNKIYFGEAARIEFEKISKEEKQEIMKIIEKHHSNQTELNKLSIYSNKNLNLDITKEFIYNINNLVKFGLAFSEEQSILLENDRNWRLIRTDEIRRKILTVYGGEVDFNVNVTFQYRYFNLNYKRYLQIENDFQKNLMNTWINRDLYMWPLQGKVTPIDNLLPEGTRRESFKKAVRLHLEAAELEDGN